MMTGRVLGERIPAARRNFDLKSWTPQVSRHMPKVIVCAHCPEGFEGPGMWNAYARHLKAEHR